MYSPEKSESDSEFYRRIKHDFRKYILLKSNGIIHVNEEAILETIYKMEGYKRHKKVIYGMYTSHIIVMFVDEYAALEAIARLNLLSCGLKAILVDDMLRCWFSYEEKTWPGLPFSMTIVDIIGNTPSDLNFLTGYILSTIFEDFGSYFLTPYTAALNEPHKQVMFNSMTEALAACMAFGEWYCMKEKTDCFFFRVRINPSDKEENLIKKCGGTPAEAFELSYFIKLNKAQLDGEKDFVAKKKGSRPKASAATGNNKTHKQECPVAQISRFRHPLGHATPILYFPIIPTNRCTSHASTTLLNLQQTFLARPVVSVTNPESVNNITRQSQNVEEIPECTDDKNSEHPSIASQNNSNRNFQRHVRGPIRTRNRQRTSRVFERSS